MDFDNEENDDAESEDDAFFKPKQARKSKHANAPQPAAPTRLEQLAEMDDDALWALLKDEALLEDDERRVNYNTRDKLLAALELSALETDDDADFELGEGAEADFLTPEQIASVKAQEAAVASNKKKREEAKRAAALAASIEETGSGVSDADIQAALRDLSEVKDDSR